MKIGRNDKCPCGSGKKFKKCCLNASKPDARPMHDRDPAFLSQAQAMLRQHQANENVRQQQQGYGNPIISWMDEVTGFRFVAVKNTLYWGRNWNLFHNFLDHFIKETLGRKWGEIERDKSQHPLFRWLQKTGDFTSQKPGETKVKTIVMMGFIACWLHLAYALYLIAHHDHIPKPLLKRLRDPAKFMPAYLEAKAGAALAVAGMEVSCAETKIGSDPTPEFRAKSKTSGKVFEVEVKCKNGWKSSTDDVTSAEFQRELESYLRDQIYKASKKKLTNPVYWIELSIPTMLIETDWQIVAEKTATVIRNAESSMTVDGQPIAAAYVIVTNHTFLANEDITGFPCFGFLQTVKMDDYPFGRPVEIEAALEGYDKHRDIFWLMEAWKTANTVPTTFDGTPPELLDDEGKSQPTVKVGDFLKVPDIEGKTVRANVEEICSWGADKAALVVKANGRKWLVEMPLTEGEAQAARRYTDAVFGKKNASRKLRDDDPFDLYDWMLKANASLSKEQVAKFFERTPSAAQYKDLPLKDARIRIAREYTKSMWITRQQKIGTKKS